jgi:hypothetical protein
MSAGAHLGEEAGWLKVRPSLYWLTAKPWTEHSQPKVSAGEFVPGDGSALVDGDASGVLAWLVGDPEIVFAVNP